MTRDQIVAFFAARQRAWDANDADALGRTHAERGTVESPIFATVTGREEITETYHALFRVFAGWRLVSDPILIDGDRVAQPFTATATHTGEFMGLPGTGRKFEIHGVLLFELHDGLIAHERRLYDFTALLIQLGVLRSRPARP
jgi:steroid delta-isomerase-like uncharacterized protein